MIQVGIIGSSGYTGGELIRILIHHPNVAIKFAYSTSNAGKPIATIHQDLIGETNMTFSDQIQKEVDVVFLCIGHGKSQAFLKENAFSERTKIIDLSSDFRLSANAFYEEKKFVYGLTELNTSKIKEAKYIANPGCFATAIQLALLPLAEAKKIEAPVHIQAVTGSTGAGVSLSDTSHFSWRDHNFSYYKPFVHQHLDEIKQTLSEKMESSKLDFHFMPYRGSFTRGIYATLYTQYTETLETAITSYQEYYKDAPFVIISKDAVHLKQVVNTNKCVLQLHKHQDTLLITSCLDNLLKGASGQAVQNMNLMYDLPVTTGLQIKGIYF